MSLPAAAPTDVGLDAPRLSVADSLVRRSVDVGVCPAAVLLVARHEKIAHVAAFGALNADAATAPDTIFDLASLTKPCVATALLTLVEDGLVALGQTVDEWLPESRGTAVGRLTVQQLATHTTGLPAWKPLYRAGGREAQLGAIFATPLRTPPGAAYVYCDLGYILLGEIVAAAADAPLDVYLRERLFGPLSMADTGYRPARALKGCIAPTANCPMRAGATLIGEVHDANAHAFGGVSGHAGLFGTAPDLAVLASALARNGKVHGVRALGAPTVRLAQTSQIPSTVGGHSIGWFTPPNPMLPRGDLFDDTLFGHTGFTGTMVVCAPAWELVVVLLTNRVMNPADNTGILQLRRRVLNVIASAVER